MSKAPIVYQIDVTRLSGYTSTSLFHAPTIEEAKQNVQKECVGDVVIGITACSFYFENGGTWKYFDEIILWFNGERAHALLNAIGYGDPQFTLCDASLPAELTHNVEFLDEAGKSVWKCEQNLPPEPTKFEIPLNNTIALSQMFEALTFWLPRQERISTPTLDWRLSHQLNQD